MKKRKLGLIILSLIVAASMLLTTACNIDGKKPTANPGGSSEVDGKYNPPINLTACRLLGPQIKFADGEDIEYNIWTSAYSEKLGINLKYTFSSPDFNTFDTKVNMAIASDSLPDILPIYTTLFFRAADNNRLADLTSVYDKYAEAGVRAEMSRNDNLTYKSCTRNGKLYALAQAPEPEMNAQMLWIRTDWLKALNLPEPKTADDVVAIAKAFANNDPDKDGEKDTFGMALNRDLEGVDGFFNMYHAYRNIWIEKNGRLERGEVQPEAKVALAKLAELYKVGAIDEEFILKTGEDLKQDYGAEMLGMVFGKTFVPDGEINQSVKSNPNAEWKMYMLPSVDSQPSLGQADSRVGNFIAANVKCKYPEAVIKLANVWDDLMLGEGSEFRAYHDKDGIDTFWYPIISMGGPPNYNYVCHQKVVEAINIGGDVSKLNGEQKGYYDRIKTWTNEKDPEGWGIYRIFGPGGSYELMGKIRDQKLFYANKGWGPETPAWKESGPELFYKQLECFTNIIVGEAPIDDFDDWVKYFNENGGAKGTEEINVWYKEVNAQ